MDRLDRREAEDDTSHRQTGTSGHGPVKTSFDTMSADFALIYPVLDEIEGKAEAGADAIIISGV